MDQMDVNQYTIYTFIFWVEGK
nr:unnamed protein product [Callosobruchus chinensis]